MLRRRESFLLLEQAVTVDSKEIDALVAKIGETLQFQRIPNGGGGGSAQQQQQYHHKHQQQQHHHHHHHHHYHQQQQQQEQEPRGSAKCGMCCIDRWKVPSRNKPYSVPMRARDPGQPRPAAATTTTTAATAAAARTATGTSAANGKDKNMGGPPPPESAAQEHNAHQKLEQLLSSGNLIKEAVRRLNAENH
ncbi:glycogen synthase kinase binding protein [Heptranchias perlo]|uniref:glycogen synthase kinase binding protein n=1 Tax=Heptranchias perlo TaxID=212740 RepID=UPI00355AA0CF